MKRQSWGLGLGLAAMAMAALSQLPAGAAGAAQTAQDPGVRTNVLLPFEKSGGKHTQVDEIVIAPGGRLSLQGFPEERLYYLLDGRGALSVYDQVGKGDTYVIRPDISLYLTPGLKHEMINTGDAPLRLVAFRITGGVVPSDAPEGVASWPVVAKPGVTVDKPAVGTGFWITYVFDERSNASVTEGQLLQVRALRLRRAQKLAVAEILILGPGGETRRHTHNDTDETLYVLMGEGNFVFDGKKIPFKAGSTISYPASGVRNVENTSNVPIMYISINTLTDAAAK
ncbi:cupin domain-containing protein [Sphingopyxis sp. LARHCG72]